MLAALLLVAAAAQADEPGLGAWKMNPAKSSFQPGPAPQSLFEIHAPAGEGVRTTISGLDARGEPFLIEYAGAFDGKEWPVSGSRLANSATFRRIDRNTVERIDRMDGRRVQVVMRVISPDGREAMVIQKGANWHNVILFDKEEQP